MPFLELHQLSKSYSSKNEILSGINLKVEKGTFTALLGESGSGKSTLLRCIAGFEYPESGSIRLNGKLLSDGNTFIKPEERKAVVVFQDFALFPHLTVAKNIFFGMDKSVSDRDEELNKLLNIVGLKEFKNRYPHELSGGQQQRVALARALAAKPDLLLLDEPFSNLDQSVKEQVRKEVARLLKKLGITTIMVTHDVADCLAIADEVMVLQQGKIVQQASPNTMYNSPVNEYVARLFGEINLLDEKTGIRPESIVLGKGEKTAQVLSMKQLGRDYWIELQYGNMTLLVFAKDIPQVGTEVLISWKDTDLMHFE